MKWLKFLGRKGEQEKDTRIYTVASHPAARAHQPVPRNVPEPDPIFADTGPLALEPETEDDANPYNTSSWKMDPDKGVRRVEDDKTVDRKGRAKDSSNNPYDTGSFRKGW
jgi:hypothetical protein